MEKTGSSALQEYLHRYRDKLREFGVIYPDLGHRSHWRFAAAVGGRRNKDHYFERRLEKYDLADSDEQILETVRSAIIGAKDDQLIILSHEDLGNYSVKTRLSEFLSDCGVSDERLSVVAYIRNPVEHFPSSLQQRLKNHSKNTSSPEEWVSNHVEHAHALLSEFDSSAHLRAFSRECLLKGDIVTDFIEFCRTASGLEFPLPHDRIVMNTSLSAQACALLQVAKTVPGHLLEKRDFVMLRGKLFKYDPELGRTRLEIPEDWRAWVATVNHEAWNPLVDQLPYGDDTKRRLKLPDIAAAPKPVSETDVKLWLMKHYDPDYTREFAKRWTANLRYKITPAAGVLAWLAESPNWMAEFNRQVFLGHNAAQKVEAQ